MFRLVESDWKAVHWDHHRGAWGRACAALRALHQENGPRLFTSVELQLVEAQQACQEPWAGFLHATPTSPAFCCIDWVFRSPHFQASLPSCLGLLTLCDYTRDYTAKRTSCPVSAVLHPIPLIPRRWSPERYLACPERKLVIVGVHHRDFGAYWKMPRIVGVRRAILEGGPAHYDFPLPADVLRIPRLSNDDYDELLSESVVFLPLEDVAACNGITDAIATHTPMLLPRLPAAVEYLGEAYPLFYENHLDAAYKAWNEDAVLAAHRYLETLDTRRLTVGGFLADLMQTEVYRRIEAAATDNRIRPIGLA